MSVTTVHDHEMAEYHRPFPPRSFTGRLLGYLIVASIVGVFAVALAEYVVRL